MAMTRIDREGGGRGGREVLCCVVPRNRYVRYTRRLRNALITEL
jgi:hypothetical protein